MALGFHFVDVVVNEFEAESHPESLSEVVCVCRGEGGRGWSQVSPRSGQGVI